MCSQAGTRLIPHALRQHWSKFSSPEVGGRFRICSSEVVVVDAPRGVFVCVCVCVIIGTGQAWGVCVREKLRRRILWTRS